MPSDVPTARDVVAAACELDCPCCCAETVKQWEIRRKWLRAFALPKMKRDAAIRRARRKHGPVTKEQEAAMWKLFAEDPDLHIEEIGKLVGSSMGRVSEILNGLRKGV